MNNEHLKFDENGYVIVTDEMLKQAVNDADDAYDKLLDVCGELAAQNKTEAGTIIYYVLQLILSDLMAQGWTTTQLCQDVKDAAPPQSDDVDDSPITENMINESIDAADELFDEYQKKIISLTHNTKHTDRTLTGFYMWKKLMAQLLVSGFRSSDLHEEIDQFIELHTGSIGTPIRHTLN